MKYFTEAEVSEHCYPDDCWVIIFGKVYDITILISENKGDLVYPLIKNAGKTITHWFDEKTKEVKTYVDPKRNIVLPYVPHGRFLDVPPPDPVNNSEIKGFQWWRNERFVIGKVTKRKRGIKVLNVLTQQEDILFVCSEDSITTIMKRYLNYNKHAESYTWKALINEKIINLDMDKNLEENDVRDETDEFENNGLDKEFFFPTLLVYFNDDLTQI